MLGYKNLRMEQRYRAAACVLSGWLGEGLGANLRVGKRRKLNRRTFATRAWPSSPRELLPPRGAKYARYPSQTRQ